MFHSDKYGSATKTGVLDSIGRVWNATNGTNISVHLFTQRGFSRREVGESDRPEAFDFAVPFAAQNGNEKEFPRREVGLVQLVD
jgi:hypothetical protein